MSQYLSRTQLEEILIGQYVEDISDDPTVECSLDVLTGDVSDFSYNNADIFRQGSCQLFALELNKKFGYRVFKIQNGKAFHIFCKSDDGGKYIDVRGVTSDFTSFISGLVLPHLDNDTSEEYSFEADDCTGKFDGIGLSFARAIIKRNTALYTI